MHDPGSERLIWLGRGNCRIPSRLADNTNPHTPDRGVAMRSCAVRSLITETMLYSVCKARRVNQRRSASVYNNRNNDNNNNNYDDIIIIIIFVTATTTTRRRGSLYLPCLSTRAHFCTLVRAKGRFNYASRNR